MADYYATLGVTKSATDAELKKGEEERGRRGGRDRRRNTAAGARFTHRSLFPLPPHSSLPQVGDEVAPGKMYLKRGDAMGTQRERQTRLDSA